MVTVEKQMFNVKWTRNYKQLHQQTTNYTSGKDASTRISTDIRSLITFSWNALSISGTEGKYKPPQIRRLVPSIRLFMLRSTCNTYISLHAHFRVLMLMILTAVAAAFMMGITSG